LAHDIAKIITSKRMHYFRPNVSCVVIYTREYSNNRLGKLFSPGCRYGFEKITW